MSVGEILVFRSGAVQFGVRWKTVRVPTVFLISWIVWMAVAPVPMIPTLFPVIALASAGQRAVWKAAPLKSFTPGIAGSVGWLRMPMQLMTKRDVYVLPSSSVIVHEFESSRQRADETLVLNCMSS